MCGRCVWCVAGQCSTPWGTLRLLMPSWLSTSSLQFWWDLFITKCPWHCPRVCRTGIVWLTCQPSFHSVHLLLFSPPHSLNSLNVSPARLKAKLQQSYWRKIDQIKDVSVLYTGFFLCVCMHVTDSKMWWMSSFKSRLQDWKLSRQEWQKDERKWLTFYTEVTATSWKVVAEFSSDSD